MERVDAPAHQDGRERESVGASEQEREGGREGGREGEREREREKLY